MSKLKRVDIACLRVRLSPKFLIDNTHIFEGGQGSHIAAKLKEYWKIWIEPDLKILLDEAEKRIDEKKF